MIDGELKGKIHTYLINKTDFVKVKDKLSDDELRVFVDRVINEVCDRYHINMAMEDRITLIRELVSSVVSLGPLRPLIEDPSVSEIMVNGPSKIYAQRDGKIQLTEIKFENLQHISHTVQKILAASGSSRRVDESSPYVDFSMPDGSRVNVILPPCSMLGPVITIRKFSREINTIDDLITRKMLDKKMAVLLIAAMKAKLNVVFCGATGTGKTTTLNVLSRHIPEEERIITIEDTPELRLLQEHVVTLQSKPVNIEGKGEITIADLFINSLRMRPDRIIIGEVRGIEMLDLIQSISSGHSGSLAIVHAESPEDCFNRMVNMMLMTGIRLSTKEIQKQIARAIDLVVHIELFPDGVRRITYISEIVYSEAAAIGSETSGPTDGEARIYMQDIFRFVQDKVEEDGRIVGHWDMNRKKPTFYKKFEKRHIKLPDGFFEG